MTNKLVKYVAVILSGVILGFPIEKATNEIVPILFFFTWTAIFVFDEID